MSRRRVPYADTLVIGAGQAGLAMGYYLAQQNRDFVILDAAGWVGASWRSRWDSLQLFTSARHSALPGLPFPAPDAYFPTKDEMADYLESYAARFDLPVQLDTAVDSLSRSGNGYILGAGSDRFEAEQVVVATGPFHHPRIPEFAAELDPAVVQLHSSTYRNPDQLPVGDVLVVGAANSGAEIAVELATAGRRVWLSGRDTGRISVGIFEGRLFWWLASTVLSVDTAVGRRVRARAVGRGAPLGRLTRTDILRAGVRRVSRTEGVAGGKPRLQDGRVLDVDAVVWATGFRPDFAWIKLPIFGRDGYPVHYRGVVAGAPGLYFLGLPFQYTLTSALIGGVGADARYIAEHMRNRAEAGHAATNVATPHAVARPQVAGVAMG